MILAVTEPESNKNNALVISGSTSQPEFKSIKSNQIKQFRVMPVCGVVEWLDCRSWPANFPYPALD